MYMYKYYFLSLDEQFLSLGTQLDSEVGGIFTYIIQKHLKSLTAFQNKI